MRFTLLLSFLLVLVALPALGPRSSGSKVDLSTTSPASTVSTCDFGQPTFGASCENDNGNVGILANITAGVFGVHPSNNYGFLGGEFYGVYGESPYGTYGALGDVTAGAFGGYGSGGPYGYLGTIDVGVYGYHTNSSNYGSIGGSFYGARGWNANDNRGYLGHDDYGVWGTGLGGLGFAGWFEGGVQVTGTLWKGGGGFQIDHPLDPEGRYLNHSFVESPDMKNVYDGNVTTDGAGQAVVELPSYFETLNRDFRYQLTVIGTFAQAIIAEEIRGNRFVIRTDQPNVKVSWQVTGIRQDRWASAHRIVVEEAKSAEDRGSYLHPDLYGQSEAQRIGWIEDKQMSPVDREAQRQE